MIERQLTLVVGTRRDVGPFHGDMRLDTVTADCGALGRIEFRGGQAKTKLGRLHPEDALDATFAVAGLANNQTSAAIGDGTGEDFAGTGAVTIDQDDQGYVPRVRAVGDVVKVFPGVAASRADDATLAQEAVGNLHSG